MTINNALTVNLGYSLVCIIFFWFLNNVLEEREMVALLLLSFRCRVTVNVLWLFLTVPSVFCSL